jgi:hypothetical protein
MTPSMRIAVAGAAIFGLTACGARSSLLDFDEAGGAGGAATSGSAPPTASVGSSGAGPCAPSEEVCDGVDDDCDGEIDETDPAVGQPCMTSGLGACAEGALGCVDGALACTPVATPTAEQCNGVDDDCDGVVDDGILCGVRRIFVTSQVYTADLGGLSGADAKCQALADAAGLGGTFKAWLSDSKTDARDRVTHVGDPYTLADGVTVVAPDWHYLMNTPNGTMLEHAIDRTETMNPAPTNGTINCGSGPSAWTATVADGTLLQGVDCSPLNECLTCNDWSSPAADMAATLGKATAINNG